MGFPSAGNEFKVLGLVASNVASCFVRFYGEMFERPKHLVDTLKKIPYVELSEGLSRKIGIRIGDEVKRRRSFFRNYEPFWDFLLPAAIQQWSEDDSSSWDPMSFLGKEADAEVAAGFGLTAQQLNELEFDLKEAILIRHRAGNSHEEDSDAGEDDSKCDVSKRGKMADLASYAIGCAFGRWDIGYATGEKIAPELPDPFAPLPVCPPGQLQNERGLPLTKEDVETLKGERRWNYPIDIPWDGILVDDPGHPLDLEARVHQVLQVIWKDRWEPIEREACEILGTPTLRDYFRKPAGFFADHLKRYSKSRRQAPIHWPLSTASGSYTLWIYYHRLNEDLLYKAVNEYVNPKISETERRIAQLEGDLASASGRQASVLRGKLEEAKGLRGELEDFKAELLRVAGLPYKPDLNDGVLISASPLWKLFRLPKWRKDIEACWKKLEAGEYDWAHLAYSIWPDRVTEVCRRDRSIAIAHGHEELYKSDASASAKKPRRARKS